MDTKEINDEIIKIWNETDENERGALSPMLYPELKDNPDVLFIGINPSFNEKYIEKEGKMSGIDSKSFNFENLSNNRENLISFERYAKTNYKRFFSSYDRLTGNIDDDPERMLSNQKKLSWESIDLFFIRNKKQDELKEIIYKDEATGELTDFAKKQLELTKKIIKNLNPKVMVVPNESASEIFRSLFKITMNDFDNEKGTFVKKIVDRELPVFFSGILSNGGIAKENLLRFKWQLNRCFK